MERLSEDNDEKQKMILYSLLQTLKTIALPTTVELDLNEVFKELSGDARGIKVKDLLAKITGWKTAIEVS